ncbi:beta-N-acetylhexosaminidase [Aspergillus clavatus NRRL 1]|uniref:beta-N-acetylhexosaminidase n=1 Tax=Aspergillus clavatus (strain ATCC 1007 / CBS 513.65 / DSM 816 / NCTC 3887 / NRRL 1 / QM 1276 / 107) TaxID=344612 RepID=A1CFQ3_ASPCL|nr:beta-N-hexosaminidase, putative [Aspergillus clavatus NRRL 1]EAW11702.1 beta-N-hexosaminidase, putative [Aspergillus clavatus NRRL 1]
MYSFVVLSLGVVAAALQLLPPVYQANSGPPSPGFNIHAARKTVYINSNFTSHKDESGLTLIPPSALEFAKTFLQDLAEVTGSRWQIQQVDHFPQAGGIFLDKLDDCSSITYEDGTLTEEGYELDIQPHHVSIRGSGARGMWWGTRTLLQQLIVSNHERLPLPVGRMVDVPSVATRGYMLDAGRKWYSPAYLKELCTYASFFKMSEFQYHTSDNYPLNRGHNETWNEVYAQFALRPENSELHDIIQRANETLSQDEFEDLEHHCAQRGVTIIPEIEAPGHCLFLTKWKPELALAKKDLLNLTHPDSIPLVKSIWKEFLPWFHTKQVHIGADEYDSTLADVYIHFANEMAGFIKEESGKRVRIWGTNEPSETLSISKDIIIQHWQYGESDPVLLARDGYTLINSEDRWAYMSLKNDHMPIFPAPYPALFNNTRVLNFADVKGWQWQPSLFNPFNVTEQLDSRVVQGAILAAWNDNGPDATTQLESFYAMRDGIPLVASRAWTGSRGPKLDESTLALSSNLLTFGAVGQNLDRKLPKSHHSHPRHSLASWTSNTHDGKKVHLGYGSKGMNYTLELDARGPFVLSSADCSLSLTPDGSLIFSSDGWQYPLRSVYAHDGFDAGHPGRIWTNQTSSTHEPVNVPLQSHITICTDVIGGSRVWVNRRFVGRFEVFVFGGKNRLFSWSQMAFVAPLEWKQGKLQRLKIGEYDGHHEIK